MRAVADELVGVRRRSQRWRAPPRPGPILRTWHEAFDDDPRAFIRSNLKCLFDGTAIFQANRDPAAMIAVLRLHHDGQAELVEAAQASSGLVTLRPAGTATPTERSRVRVSLLVLRDTFRNRGRTVRFGRPDPALSLAVAELHEIAGARGECTECRARAAALTIACVLGPRQILSASSRKRRSSLAMGKSRPSAAAITSSRPADRQASPKAGSSQRTTTL
jgi:hypothetical protein